MHPRLLQQLARRCYTTAALQMTHLTPHSLNQNVHKVQYAVRGEIAIKAEEHREKLKEPDHGLPFDAVVTANIGNPQQQGLDQKPLTFTRQVRAGESFMSRRPLSATQVAALLEYPPLMDLGKDIFPKDAIARARELNAEIGSIGAYSHSQGVPFIRKNVAKFISGSCCSETALPS